MFMLCSAEVFDKKHIDEFMHLTKEISRQNVENENWFLLANYDNVWDDRNESKKNLFILKT